MKTNLLKTLFVLAFFGATFKPQSIYAQSAAKFLTVRTLEVVDDNYQGKIVIIDEDGKVTEIKLLKFKPGVFTENSKRIHDAINEVTSKGYSMVGSSGGAGAVFLITTYLFQKNVKTE
jgi:hypothetical protein